MASTRTGSFPVGIRYRNWSWMRDLDDMIRFAVDHEFEVIDVSARTVEEYRRIIDAGLRIGSTDLPDWPKLCSADADERRDTAQANADYIRSVAPAGALIYFTVIMADDQATDRAATFAHAVDGYGQLCQAIESSGAKIAIEGWPGKHPHFSHLACNPEGYRRLIDEVGSDVLGINFDPSHLIRMGIDSVRFLEEFVGHVCHVHAKDTELLDENRYEIGHTQAAMFPDNYSFGGLSWRYTLPGHGVARWTRMFQMLQQGGYRGVVCIEHEDQNFYDGDAMQQRGFIAARDFLVHA